MDSARVLVRAVKGRYPQRPGRLEGKRIEARVAQEGGLVVVRLDDAEREDFWLEIALEIPEVSLSVEVDDAGA